MNHDLQFFWITGAVFGLLMVFLKIPLLWKYVHSIIFLSYYVYAYWEINGKNSFGYLSEIISFFTIVHIIIFLIGNLIFGFFRRQHANSDKLKNLYSNPSEENKAEV